MAKGKKTGGKNFTKGKSGNPKGRPKTPPDVRNIRALSKTEFTRIANEFLWLSTTAADKKLKSRGLSQFEKAVGQTVKKAAAGDLMRLNMVLDRLIGKPRDKMELTVPKPFIILNADGTEAMTLGAEVTLDD